MSPLEKLEVDDYNLSEADRKAFLSVVNKKNNLTETSMIKAEVNEMKLIKRPYCSSKVIVANGKNKDVHRYLCNQCG